MQFQVSTTKQCLYTVSDLEGLGIVSKILKSERGLSCPEWINLLGSMGSLFKVAELPVADAYPNAKLVLSATQAIFEMFMEQQERDERILRLIQLMASLYQMILESEPLETYGQVLKQSISDLIALTRECAYFINHYLKTYSFAQRAVQAPFSGVDEIISQFEKQFFMLKDIFTTGIALSIGQVNVRILKNLENVQRSVDHIVDMISLPILGRSWKKSDGCLEGTQEALLSKIYEWGTNIKDETSPNIYLLLGGSKFGKTAVSHTVADFFHSQRRLGATVFFDSGRSNSCKDFFSSIIRELCKYDPTIRDEVMLGLRDNEKFINDPPLRQFEFLDFHVFSKLTMVGPTVVVVDGLDKCMDRDWSFLAQLSKFPANIRLFITSQPAEDIIAAFRSGTYIRHDITLNDELDKDYWESLDAYISTFLNILELSRPSIYRIHSRQYLAREIHLKSFGIYILAQAVLEFIATVEADAALKFLDLLFSSPRPEYAEQAKEYIKEALLSILKTAEYPSVGVSMLGKWRHELDESVHSLVASQCISLTNGQISTRKYNIVLGMNITGFEQCTPPTRCNISDALEVLSSIGNLKHYPILRREYVASALHCIFTCKCTYPPYVYEGFSRALISEHWDTCVRKSDTRTEGSLSLVSDSIRLHHEALEDYTSEQTNIVADFPAIVLLTPPIKHSASSKSTDRITLLEFRIKATRNVHLEAAIYRATTEEGQNYLDKKEETIIRTKDIIDVPSQAALNKAGIHVLKHPLSGNTSWFIKNIQNHELDWPNSMLWFNTPIPSDDDSVEEDLIYGEGRGIGFVNYLLPGDRIAVIASAESTVVSRLEVSVTLYQDKKEKCSL